MASFAPTIPAAVCYTTKNNAKIELHNPKAKLPRPCRIRFYVNGGLGTGTQNYSTKKVLRCATYKCNEKVDYTVDSETQMITFHHRGVVCCPNIPGQHKGVNITSWNKLQPKRMACIQNMALFKVVYRRCSVCDNPTKTEALQSNCQVYVTQKTVVFVQPSLTIDIVLASRRDKNCVYPDESHLHNGKVHFFRYTDIISQLRLHQYIYIDAPTGVLKTDTCENHLPVLQYPLAITEHRCVKCNTPHLDDTILTADNIFSTPVIKHRTWKHENTVYILAYKDTFTRAMLQKIADHYTSMNIKLLEIPSRNLHPPNHYTVADAIIRCPSEKMCILCTETPHRSMCRICNQYIEPTQPCPTCASPSSHFQHVQGTQYAIQKHNATVKDYTVSVPNLQVKCIDCGCISRSDLMAQFTPCMYDLFQKQKPVALQKPFALDILLYICGQCVKCCFKCSQLLPNTAHTRTCANCT